MLGGCDALIVVMLGGRFLFSTYLWSILPICKEEALLSTAAPANTEDDGRSVKHGSRITRCGLTVPSARRYTTALADDNIRAAGGLARPTTAAADAWMLIKKRCD